MLVIRTDGGVITPLVAKYNGTFEDGIYYTQESFVFQLPNPLTILYDANSDNRKGTFKITNNTIIKIPSSYNSIEYNNNVICSTNVTGSGDYARASAIILYVDNDNNYALNMVDPMIREYSGYNTPTSGKFGSAYYENVTFGGYGVYYLQNVNNDIKNSVKDITIDPFSPAGNTDTGGGTGDFDGDSDPIDFPSLPSLSAVDTGFITLFNPSLAELKSLADYMWNDSLFDISTFQKLFANPMDAILGLSIIPVSVPDAGQHAVKVGNITTSIVMNKAASQYIEIDCGTLNVNEFWGAYLDYAPFTKAEIYLPYCGTHAIDVDDIMNNSVHVKYHVDILSGACCAYVKCGVSVLYQFIGQCSSSIPISGTDFTQMINGVLSAAVSIGSMIGTGGMSAPLALPALANTAVNSMKPLIEKSAAISGTGGMLAIQKPYLILTRPNQALPVEQNHYIGYPSFITENLGDLSGYTEIEKIHLENVPATDDELNEIETLLKGGVIL